MTSLLRRPRDPRLVVRVVLCGLLVPLVVLEAFNPPLWSMRVAVAVSGLLCLVALAVPRRLFGRWSACAVAWSLAVTAVQAHLAERPENTPGMVELLVLIALVVRSVRIDRLARAGALVAGASLAAGSLLLRLEERSEVLATLLVGVVAALPFAVLLGLYLRLRDTLRARQRQAVLQAQRLEHARDLHDFVAHHITAIVARTRAARYTAGSGRDPSPEELDGMLDEIERAGAEALESMRAMVSELRDSSTPAATRPPGDLRRVRDLVADFTAASPTGPRVELSLDPRLLEQPPPPELSTSVHRLVQEALTNVRRHAAGARAVTVRVARVTGAPELEVNVTDDGSPAPVPESAGGGYGLVGLTERVEELGGSLRSGPLPTGGWQVRAVLPWRKAAS
ncbi:histidine kinase [Streptomyces sp. NPDC005438]|uniref:sensor histidine kinase n=1 Tax=Streptomyces sp. NPDC005438 TaxID=3156880 RepID=UPI0033B8F030